MFPKTIIKNSKTVWQDNLRWEAIPNSNQVGLINSSAWNLTYQIPGAAIWQGSPNSIGWLFILEPRDVQFSAGSYLAQAILSQVDAPATQFLCNPISFIVIDDLSEPSPNYDGRSQAEKELEAVNAAIMAILDGKSSSYSLAGRSVTALDLNTLYQIQGKLKIRIAREQGVSTRSVIRFV